ncbi:MAG: ABC transporter substrate-binding protein [Xanthobacteraceae bacterium]
MKRREFIALLGGAALARPLVARAQQADMPRVGYLSGRSPQSEAPLLAAVRRGLAEAGYVENQNVTIEFRFSEGRDDRLRVLAADLVGRNVAVLVASDYASAAAGKKATATIPIVFTSGLDPVQAGLVASFNRPGGNATGIGILTSELGPKRLEVLRELVPKAQLIAFLMNPSADTAPFQSGEILAAAQSSGQRILIVNAGNAGQIEDAFSTMAESRVDAILYSGGVFFQVHHERLVALAARHAIPAMYEWREFVTAGGLISYSPSRPEVFRQAGLYVGRILKGENPADLPVIRPTKFELVINLKTANALGLEIPPTMLARADEVIE